MIRPTHHVAFNLSRRDVQFFADYELILALRTGWTFARSCWTEEEAAEVSGMVYNALFREMDDQ